MDDCCSNKGNEIAALGIQREQRRVLIIVLAINFLMFFVEFGAGIAAGSAALMADSVDMLGDALVYGLGLFAIARGPKWEAGAALAKGVIILLFGIGVLIQLGFKIVNGVPPSSDLMLAFGALALAANLSCLALLWRFRRININMTSTFECSRNDVISNVGVLLAAGLVAFFASPWPDIVVGGVIVLLFVRSSARVLRGAWPQWRTASIRPRTVRSSR